MYYRYPKAAQCDGIMRLSGWHRPVAGGGGLSASGDRLEAAVKSGRWSKLSKIGFVVWLVSAIPLPPCDRDPVPDHLPCPSLNRGNCPISALSPFLLPEFVDPTGLLCDEDNAQVKVPFKFAFSLPFPNLCYVQARVDLWGRLMPLPKNPATLPTASLNGVTANPLILSTPRSTP